jgi:hypothetical protein
MRKFLLATLANGTAVVGEFDDLGGTGQGYATQVFALAKPFNAWRVTGTQHPASGEAVKVRTRVMYGGHQIVSIQQVKPKTESHGYDPQNFEPVEEIQRGQYGVWTAPAENTPDGARAGLDYPIHRESTDLRRYVILTAAGPDGTGEVRHYIDAGESARTYGSIDDVTRAAESEGGSVATATDEGPADADEDREF